MEIELAARDTSGPALSQFGSTVKRTFEQASQDAAQASKGASLLDRTFGNLADTVRAVGLAFGAYEAARYAQQAVMLAARYETLGVTLQQLGKTAGYSKAFLDQQEEALRKAGITAIGSRESLARMIQANLDLSKSAQLARVAQDAAAISGVNSSEAYKQIVYGIQSAQVEMLRTVGINVSFENSYAAVAAQTGRTAASLGEAEKAQIRLNAVLEAGKGISGAYEAAMGTAGKQILSFQRYAEDLQVELGKAFGPALASIVGQAVESIGSLTRSVSESASGGMLKSIGDGLQWVAEHSGVATTALAGFVAVMAMAKAESWLLAGGLGQAIGMLGNVSQAFTALKAVMVAHPLITLMTILAAVATATSYLADKLGLTDEAMRRQAESAARTTREYSSLRDTVDGVAGPIQQYQAAVAKANGDQQKQLEALKGLNAVFPELTGEYHSAAEGIANVNANLERFLVLKRAELELLKDKAEKEQSDRLGNLGRRYEELMAKMERSQRSMSAAFQRNQASSKGQIWAEDKAWAEAMRDLYIEAGKVASAKGISQEMRDSAMDLQGKASLATKAVISLKEAMRMLGLEVKNVQAPIDQIKFPTLNLADKKVSEELYKLGNEAQKALMHPNQARLFEINQEVAKQTQELWANLPEGMTGDVALAGEAQIQAWANAQRAALAPELAKTQAEWARGYYEIGATTREQLLANLQAEAGVLAAGGDRTRSQYLQTQKAITDLTLQGYRERQAITEASFNLGREGQGALIAAYQAELAILPALKMSAEDRARRELELTTKIRDVKEQGFTRELDLNKQRVSWMAEGTAKHQAQLDLQEAEELHHLEVLFAANQDLQNKKKQILDEYEKFAQRRREEAASKERQQALDVQLQTAKLYGNTRLAKELELAKYAESLKTSGINQIYHEQLIANERVRINRTGVESMLLQWSDFYEGWDKIGENFLQNVQSDISGAFKSAFEGTTTLWEGMWASMKNISYQALAAISTRLLTYGIGQLAINIMPGLAGPLGMTGNSGGGLGSILSLLNTGKSAYNLFGKDGLFSGAGDWFSGLFGGGGGSGFAGDLASEALANDFAAAIQMGDTIEEALAAVSASTSALSYILPGLSGALGGYSLSNMLYGGQGYSGAGGALGGAAGAIAGQILIPVPGLGAIIGGALGSAGGGFLGSLFGEDDETPDYEKPGHPEAHWKELSARVEDLTQRLKDGKLTQEDFNSTLAGLAPLAAGAGDYLGGYGKTIGGTIEALGQLTQGTQEYADKVNTELNPAWIIATGLAQNLADGMDKLDAHKKALGDAIDALAASSGLGADQQSQLVDLVIRQSGSVAELTDKYNRYNEIKKQLAEAHDMERGQVEALGAELRALHDELGIAANPMDNLTKVTGSLDKTMQSLEKTMRAIFNLPDNKEFNITTNYNQNGTPTAHTGSLVSAALAHGYITRHGGGPAPVYAHAGNPAWDPPRPGEVDIRALMGEWVIQPAAVDFYGNDFLAAINDMRVPVRTGASGGAVPLAAAGGPPVIQPYFDFRGASFGSDAQETAQLIGDAVDDRLRALMADMDQRGENPAVRHCMGVDS